MLFVGSTLLTPTFKNHKHVRRRSITELPSLWTNDVETWFAQAEAQFALRDITNETSKFNHVVSVLSADVASKVSSILQSPPGHNPYTALKKQLTCKYQLTEHERAAAIFNIPALGDERPSQIMDRMLHLLGGCEGGILFISILPIYVKNTLALSTTTDLQQLALEADRIFLSGQPDNSTVMSTTTDDSTTEVSRIQRNNSKHHTSRTLCFFHERFRSRAKKCVQHMSFKLPAGSAVVNTVDPDHPAQLLVRLSFREDIPHRHRCSGIPSPRNNTRQTSSFPYSTSTGGS